MISYGKLPILKSYLTYARLLLPLIITLSFQNGVDVWRNLSARMDDHLAVFLTTLLLATSFLIWAKWLKLDLKKLFRKQTVFIILLLTTLFWLPDPQFAAKQVHVPEYILIALLCRWALDPFFQNSRYLSLGSFLMVAFLGIHDEILQGFHPERYFGYMDIIVNMGSGAVGCWLGDRLLARNEKLSWDAGPQFYLLISYCTVATLLFLSILWRYKGLYIPAWAILPYCGSVLALLISPKPVFVKRDTHLIFHLFVFSSMSLGLYLVGGHALSLSFN